MFTQCDKCETVFRLSAQALRAAGGQVRCGRCGEVFNALARLAEDASGFKHGESSFELETRADQILQSVEPVAPAIPQISTEGNQVAQLEVMQTAGDDLEASLEFTLPPAELDRIFIETTPSLLQVLAAEARRERLIGPPATAPAAAGELTALAPPMPSPAAPEPALASESLPGAASAVAAPPSAAPAPASDPPAPPQPAAPRPAAGLAVSEGVRQAMLAGYAQPAGPTLAPPRRIPLSAWVASAVLLAALLAVQLVLDNADWLSSRLPLFGNDTATLRARLASYQLRQWGVNQDPAAKGALRVRATIVNTAKQMQPYPLLRVALANHAGARIAAREFEPAEYLGKPVAHPLAPGERTEATLDIVDPGSNAESFEIDVCIRAGRRMLCAGDAAPR